MRTRKRWISLAWVALLLVGCSQAKPAEGQADAPLTRLLNSQTGR